MFPCDKAAVAVRDDTKYACQFGCYKIHRLEKTEPYQHSVVSRKCTRVCDEAALQYHLIDCLKTQIRLKAIFDQFLSIFMDA